MSDKYIVLTLYGNGKIINDFTITLFDKEGYSYSDRENIIKDYCANINNIELKDDNWIYAKIINENEKIKIEKPWSYTDFDILGTLEDRSIQKVIRKADNYDLRLALKSAKNETLKAILRNMSKMAAKMIIEDMGNMFFTSAEKIIEAQRRIVNIMQQMEYNGEIGIIKFISDNKI